MQNRGKGEEEGSLRDKGREDKMQRWKATIKNLEREKVEVDKEYLKQNKILERKKRELKHEEEKNALIIRAKEKEQRMGHIKMKEIMKIFSDTDLDQSSLSHTKYSKLSDSKLMKPSSQSSRYKPKLRSAKPFKSKSIQSISSVKEEKRDNIYVQEAKNKV